MAWLRVRACAVGAGAFGVCVRQGRALEGKEEDGAGGLVTSGREGVSLCGLVKPY